MKKSLFLFIGWVVLAAFITAWWFANNAYSHAGFAFLLTALLFGELLIITFDYYVIRRGAFKR